MAQIIFETNNQDFIDDLLIVANNRFDFDELEITQDGAKIKHLMGYLVKKEVNDLRRSRAVSQVQFIDVSNEPF